MNSIHISKTPRQSGIEALKLFAILLIIISHVSQTALSNQRVTQVIDLSQGTDNLQFLFLELFFHFGKWGNTIFFTCTAWFLLSSNTFDKSKWFFMLFEIWVISVAILIIAFPIVDDITFKHIIKSLFPTFFGNNWYLTCYLLFYPIHPFLNSIINKMEKQQLFRVSLALFLIYFCFSLLGGSFFGSTLIYWVTIYFVIAYCKYYLINYTDSMRLCIIAFFISLIGFIGLILITNVLCLHFSAFKNQINHWNVNNNPFLLGLSVSMFQMSRKIKFNSKLINYLSSLSMLIYILHENLILRTYIRPLIINYINLHYGYNHIAIMVFFVSLFIFLLSAIVCTIYKETIQKGIKSASATLFRCLRHSYLILECKIINL